MEIIIVGAGIAGLSAGIAMRRAGHHVLILERSSLLQETGAAVNICPNATRVLESFDFSSVRSRCVLGTAGRFVHGVSMETLNSDYYKEDMDKVYGAKLYYVHRVDLHNELRFLATREEGVGEPCVVRTRSEVLDYDTEKGKVILADGTELQADLVIAADGVHTKAVKHVLDGGEANATETGWCVMRFLMKSEELLNDPETAGLMEGQEGRMTFFMGAKGSGLVWYPCRNNTMQNLGYVSRIFDYGKATEDFRASVENSELQKYAKEEFSPSLQALTAKAKDIKFWKLVARDPIPRWHKNRLVCIGDAAHPMLPFHGQGAAQAIEDAGALGILFRGLETPDQETIEGRLRLFEQVRRNRGSALQVLSTSYSSDTPEGQKIRDAAAEFMPEGKKLESVEETSVHNYRYDVLKESEKVLEKYFVDEGTSPTFRIVR